MSLDVDRDTEGQEQETGQQRPLHQQNVPAVCVGSFRDAII